MFGPVKHSTYLRTYRKKTIRKSITNIKDNRREKATGPECLAEDGGKEEEVRMEVCRTAGRIWRGTQTGHGRW